MVSILTGLERPVQPFSGDYALELAEVSILTGLERPVQRVDRRPVIWYSMFQSSPALKDRCNHILADAVRKEEAVSILTGLERPVQRIVWN